MNETQKTGILAGLTAVVILLAVVTRPHSVTKQEEKGGLATGGPLFKDDVVDISKAASLKIIKFDENNLEMQSFEVVKDKTTGLWKIPSEYDYPVDAEDQLKNAITPLTDLRIVSINEDAGRDDQALYGVIEPDEKLEAGVTGVGMLVSVGDAAGKTMASVIIGKKVDKAQENLHYVRIPSQDPIYIVDLDPSVFDTNFKKWIKPDLLRVKSFDIAGVGIRNYQIERTQTGGRLGAVMSKNMEADATYQASSSKWKLDRMVTFEEGEPKDVELGENEELKSDKLNALRTAAQSLQIVGVRPKPKGLAADLKADKTLLDSDESMLSLFEQGFIPQTVGDTSEIFAVAGETLLTTQDGVRYTLRFGQQPAPRVPVEATEPDEDKPEDAAGKRERYLLVTAALEEGHFPQPELQVVPETIEDLKKMDAEKSAAAAKPPTPAAQPAESAEPQPPAPDAKSEDAKPEDAKPEDAKPEDAKPEDAKPEDAKPEDDKPEEPKDDAEEANAEEANAEEPGSDDSKSDAAATEDKPAEDTPAAEDKPAEEKAAEENACGPVAEAQDEGEAKPAADKKDDEPATEDKPAEKPAGEDKPAENEKPADAAKAPEKPAEKPADKPADKPAEKAETEEELKDRLSAVQEDIKKSNKRLLDAREEKMNAARRKVQELNARFADWYYLIEESSFKQLMLKKDDLIGPKGPAPESLPGGPGAAPSFPGLPPLGEQ